MKTKLSKSLIDSLSPEDRTYKIWDSDIRGLFLRISPKGTKTFAIFYRFKGIGRDYNIGRYGNITLQQARILATTAFAQIAVGNDVLAQRKENAINAKRHKNNTLGFFILEKYKPWIEAEHKSAKQTIEMLDSSFSHLYEKNLNDITPWLVQKWSTSKLKSGTKKSTINRRIAALKALLNKAVEWETIAKNPIKDLRPLKSDSNRIVRYLTERELSRLNAALDDRQIKQRKQKSISLVDGEYTDYLKPMFILAINTGLRRGELFNLKWSDINFDQHQLTVSGQIAKNSQTRHIPLNTNADKTLREWRKHPSNSDIVFPNPKTNKNLTTIKSAWCNLIKSANVKNLRFHDLRHHFASSLVMQGVDLNVVRELLGHSSLQMTLRYSHLSPEHKAHAVSLIASE